jgi:chromosome segregation ATPase
LLEENVRLKDEADTLYGEKVQVIIFYLFQNDALKTQIYAMSMKQDVKSLASSEALSPTKNSTDLTAEIQILRAEKQAAQDLLKQMRSDRDKLETQLRNQSVDLQEVKLLLESEKKKGMADGATSGRFWWGKGATNQPATVDSSTLSLSQPSTDNNGHVIVPVPIEASQTVIPEVASAQAPTSTSAVRSWWGGKSAAPAVNSLQSKTEASVPSASPAVNSNLASFNPALADSNAQQLSNLQNEISSIKQERIKLQSDLDTISQQNRDQKEMYESQIQNEKKKTVEAERKVQESCSAADNLKETILILEDKLSQANDQVQAQKQDLEIKSKNLMETANYSVEDDSKRSYDLHVLQQRHELDIQALKESQERELQEQEKILLDKIILLQESLRLASSSDSDIITNLEAKYHSIIQEKDNQIKSSIQENQIRLEALIKKHEEELQTSKQGFENQDKRIVAEHLAQVDKLNQIQKELNERIGKKEAEVLDMSQKYQIEKQKLQIDFEEKLKQSASSTEEKIRIEKLEAAEKITKEKNDLETQLKREKKELEDNFNKEKQKLVYEIEVKKKEVATLETTKADLTKKLEKSTSDLEKLKKESAANDSQKSESIKKLEKDLSLSKDELNKSQTKVKSLETENTQLKADKQNYTEAVEKKLKDTQSGFELKLQDYEQIKEEKTKLSSKINELNESIKRLESANQTQIAEYEVLKSSYDRTTKSNQEKDDNIKKLKAKAEELTKSEASIKKSMVKTSQEKEVVEKQLKEANDKINTSESRIQQLQDELINFGNDWKQQTEQLAIIENEKNDLISKIENLEKDYKLTDRKNTIMVIPQLNFRLKIFKNNCSRKERKTMMTLIHRVTLSNCQQTRMNQRKYQNLVHLN